jgi:hypothetical protein
MTRRLVAILFVIASLSCGESPPSGPPPPAPPPPPPPPPPPAPGPGRLAVVMTSPNADDGAILLEIRGTGIDSVRAENATWEFFSDKSSASVVRAVVAGNLASGRLVNFYVPDVSGTYTVTIMDIATRQNMLRASTGYTFTVAP